MRYKPCFTVYNGINSYKTLFIKLYNGINSYKLLVIKVIKLYNRNIKGSQSFSYNLVG